MSEVKECSSGKAGRAAAGPRRRRLLLPGSAALFCAYAIFTASLKHAQAAYAGGAAWDGPVLIRGGTVVNAEEGERLADVFMRNGIIEDVDSGLIAPAGTHIIDATGMYVMPGGIDPHTHFEMPFMGTVTCDDYTSGQAAGLAGGTTYHIDFALPVNHDLRVGLAAHSGRAAARAVTDYSFHVAVTSWSDEIAAAMAELSASGGVASFKFFMAYKGALMVDDAQLLRGLLRCKQLGAVPMVHAENGDAVALGQERMARLNITGPEGHSLSRPPVLEGEATGRAIRLARFVGAPLYVVHVTCADAITEITAALKGGQVVVGEAVASGLALDESHAWDTDWAHAARHVMSPPIRSAAHREALQDALEKGLLQLVATDHAAFNSSQKAVGRHDFRAIPNGVNGAEERLHIVWTTLVAAGRISPADFVRVTSSAAARIFNVYPRKGVIAVGSDADIIVLDPRVRHVLSAKTHHSRLDGNVFEGVECLGKVVVTVARGRVVWEHGQLRVEPGTGRFVPLKPFGPLYTGIETRDVTYLPFPTPVDRAPPPPPLSLGGAASVEHGGSAKDSELGPGHGAREEL